MIEKAMLDIFQSDSEPSTTVIFRPTPASDDSQSNGSARRRLSSENEYDEANNDCVYDDEGEVEDVDDGGDDYDEDDDDWVDDVDDVEEENYGNDERILEYPLKLKSSSEEKIVIQKRFVFALY